MQIFLAGGESRHWIQDNLLENQKKKKIQCKYFLQDKTARIEYSRNRTDATLSRRSMALEKWGGYDNAVHEYKPYILESFFYADEDTERLLPYFGDFLLDSGAFTFMQGKGGSPNWDDYVERYADFIRRNNIKKYFELDIDSVVGYEKVKGIRTKLERLAGRPCIPVWHLSRGIDEYKKMCDEYNYVAIGGIVSGEITKDKYKFFPSLIAEAHKRGAKVHGLGFTNLSQLRICHFDSVDSTAWTTGNRFGFLYWFDGKTMRKKDVPKGSRITDSRKVALNNFNEWLKFQKYAENHL